MKTPNSTSVYSTAQKIWRR